MSKLNYVMGMLAACGAVAASSADAGTIVYTLDLPITSDATTTSITLLGAPMPQYQFGSFANATTSVPLDDAGLVSYGILTGVGMKSDVGIVLGYTVGGQPLTESQFLTDFETKSPALSIAPQNPVAEIETGTDGTSPPAGTDHYTYLIFTTGAPTGMDFDFGVAHFNADNELETITVTTVPEPETWALLLAGAGLAGGALRRNRRRAALAA